MTSKGSFTSFVLHLHPRRIPERAATVRFTWCLGGLAVWMFVLELVTGLLLALHYAPTVGAAYQSLQDIAHVVPYGFFIRNLHYWCGQIMVALVVLHMVRVFLTGSFARPRHLNWLIGLGLLVITLLVDFTGYLLVWDDRSLWAWTIARNLTETVPLIGAPAASFLFGPAQVGDASLIRIYLWHVILWPGILAVLMLWHFWRIRKDGGISVPL
ncbi:MAG: cytochrome b N-terminal domain-containing protein [Desulfomonile tiedjei]|nr:cytochrome b N-terminal domain-containing protein [Desulfomonile tiedjei]